MYDVKPTRGDRGIVLIFIAIGLVVLLGVAALAIDVGQMYIARQRAQNVCDAAALAGAAFLDPDRLEEARVVATTSAQGCALANNESGKWIVYEPDTEVQGVSVTFPDATSIRAKGDVKVVFGFARVLGFQSTRVPAFAIARLEPLKGFNYPALPLGVSPAMTENLQFGQVQTLKTDKWKEGLDVFIGSGNFSPVVLPGDSRGAQVYKGRLAGTKTDPVSISVGDVISTETGNMVGPTDKSLNARLDSDTAFPDDNTAWDLWSATWNPSEMTFDPTPRLVVLPVIEGQGSGRTEVTVAGFAAFFIESVEAHKVKVPGVNGNVEYAQVTGRFVVAAIGAEAMRCLWWMGQPNQPNKLLRPRLVE